MIIVQYMKVFLKKRKRFINYAIYENGYNLTKLQERIVTNSY